MQNIFNLEKRIDEMYDVVYPVEPRHPSGRAIKPVMIHALGCLVPLGDDTRKLQRNREYVKVDFQDFLDYATCEISPSDAPLSRFPDRTAIFYDRLQTKPKLHPLHATWTAESGEKYGISILDAVVARDDAFVSVTMRFAGMSTMSEDGHLGFAIKTEEGTIAETGVTIIFAPEKYSRSGTHGVPVMEVERAMWWPSERHDPEWRFGNSGELTSHALDNLHFYKGKPDLVARIREAGNLNYSRDGVFFEVARLGLKLPSYVDFMYDVIVTEKRKAGTRRIAKKRGAKNKKRRKPTTKPVFKIISSVRVVRPEESGKESLRQWTAPAYSYLVKGHWRQFDNPNRKGRDENGNEILGKTWVRGYRKFKEKDEISAERRTADPGYVIGVKQTLASARDIIRAFNQDAGPHADNTESQTPTDEWIAQERSKLTAGLRYLILKRDGFRCVRCGRSSVDDNYVKLEVDHKTPVSKWGLTTEDNLETLCFDCNRGKSDNL